MTSRTGAQSGAAASTSQWRARRRRNFGGAAAFAISAATLTIFSPLPGVAGADLELGYIAEITGDPQCGVALTTSLLKGIKDVNARRTHLCPAIGDITESFTLSVESLDGVSSATGILNGAMKLLGISEWADAPGGATTLDRVHGIVGPNWSGDAKAITPFFNVFDMPLIALSATSGSLSDKSRYLL